MGDTPLTQLLPMKDVLSGNTGGPSKEILYADYISKSDVVQAFNNLLALKQSCQNPCDLITNSEELMKKTNSNQFYNGTLAQQQFQNMNDISGKFTEIKDYLINSTDELTIMENEIERYNEELEDLKKNCRRDLLANEAEKFNKQKNEWTEEGFPKLKDYYWTSEDISPMMSPSLDGEFNYCYDTDCEIYEYQMIYSSERDCGDYYKYSARYKIHKYKYIKYWNFFKSIKSLFDPSFSQVEALYAKVGLELPYDPNSIVGRDANK